MPEEECKGGDCPLRPQFDDAATQEPQQKKVRLSTSKYVQLLIDARETDPDCWPPGLEQAAALIERARSIEEACVEEWGEFDPDKLSGKPGREYFEIQLALDSLQEEAGDGELSMESALEDARHSLDEVDESEAALHDEPSHDQTRASEPPSHPSTPAPDHAPDHDGPSPGASGSFYASSAGTVDEANVVLSFALGQPVAEEAPLVPRLVGWVEVPPLQRPDNFA